MVNIWGGTEDGLLLPWGKDTTVQKRILPPAPVSTNLVNNVICDQKVKFMPTYLELLRLMPKIISWWWLPIWQKTSVIQMFSIPVKTVCWKDENSNTLWVATRGGMFCYDLNNKHLYSPHDQAKNPIFANRLCVPFLLSKWPTSVRRQSDERNHHFEPSTKNHQFHFSGKLPTRRLHRYYPSWQAR